MIQNNWSCDTRAGSTFKKDVMEEYFVEEVDLFVAHETELEEASCFEDDVDNRNSM